MSTRCNIVVKDKWDKPMWFYRHSDGYPEGAMPILKNFMDMVRSGHIRNNASQGSGWLIILGAQEYNYHRDYTDQSTYGKPRDDLSLNDYKPGGEGRSGMGWKVGSIEPTTGIHGDIEFLYVLDMEKMEIRYKPVGYDSEEDILESENGWFTEREYEQLLAESEQDAA